MNRSQLLPIGLVCVCAVAAHTARAVVAPQCLRGPVGLQGLLDAEYAFGEKARSSVRAAFLDNLAEDSLVLQPGPVSGRAFYSTAKDSKDRLEWYPALAEVAASDDLGFTSGPWLYTVAANGEQLHGHFLSIWKRDAQCQWRVAFDGGVSHGAPADAEPKLSPDHASAAKREPPPQKFIDADAAGHAVSDFQVVTQQNGVAAGLHTFARLKDFTLYVDGEPPMAITAAGDYLDRHPIVGAWKDVAHGRSADATLAYSVGELTDAKQRSTHAYVQIWQYDPRVANWGLRVLLMTRMSTAKEKS